MKRLALLLLVGIFVFPARAQESWILSTGAVYMNRHTAYGIDLGNELSACALSASAGISGFSLGTDALRTLGAGGELQYWSLSAGYELALSDFLSVDAAFTHYEYSTDSANVLAPFENSIGLSLDLDADVVSAGLSYDRYLGGTGGSFIGLNFSSFVDLEHVWIVPLVHATFMSQEIEDKLLKGSSKGMGGGSGGNSTVVTTTTVTGLSSVSLHAVILVPIVGGLTVSMHPSYLYSPKSELSASSSHFVWSVGLRYSGSL